LSFSLDESKDSPAKGMDTLDVLDPNSEEQEPLKMQRTRSNDQGSSHSGDVG
jgi:hypothetical protein